METIFRIQSIRNESLWYSFDGKFTDRIKKITGQSIPMPFDKKRETVGKVKLLSAVADINNLPLWFSSQQIEKLFNNGYSLFEYQVENYLTLPKGEILFDYNKAIKKENQDLILKVYNIGSERLNVDTF